MWRFSTFPKPLQYGVSGMTWFYHRSVLASPFALTPLFSMGFFYSDRVFAYRINGLTKLLYTFEQTESKAIHQVAVDVDKLMLSEAPFFPDVSSVWIIFP
ncbi:MAG: hypothetical protein CENE_02052 [Candidatus Celerinatantimonas neptuna]|nr:MAG: hypothetical protein CENE_02052 [Candidatus Celerinatantimonas neptuna]